MVSEKAVLRGGSRKFRKRGPSPPPPPPPDRKKTLLFSQHAAYSIVVVFMMQSKAMLTFRKKELKRTFYKTISRTVRRGGVVQKCFEKGGRGPIGPSPKSAYGSDLSYGHFVLPL